MGCVCSMRRACQVPMQQLLTFRVRAIVAVDWRDNFRRAPWSVTPRRRSKHVQVGRNFFETARSSSINGLIRKVLLLIFASGRKTRTPVGGTRRWYLPDGARWTAHIIREWSQQSNHFLIPGLERFFSLWVLRPDTQACSSHNKDTSSSAAKTSCCETNSSASAAGVGSRASFSAAGKDASPRLLPGSPPPQARQTTALPSVRP